MPRKNVQWENRESSIVANFLRNIRETIVDYNLTKKKRFKFSHVANETQSKLENFKNKRLGVEPGVPDFLIALPSEISLSGSTETLYIEIKAESLISGKVGQLSKEQKEWLEILGETRGNKTYSCVGHQAAITFILDQLSVPVKKLLHQTGHIEIIEDRRWIWKLLDLINSGERETSNPEPMTGNVS